MFIIIFILALLLTACSPAATQPQQSPQSPAPTEQIVQATQAPRPEITDFSSYSSLSTKSVNWGLKKVKNSEPEIPLGEQSLLENYDSYYMDKTKPKALYLTFDEGYENGYTSQILDVLSECEVPAAFFVTGPYVKTESDLVTRMVDEGHIVGNHTVHHPNMSKLTPNEVASELNSLDQSFFDLTGVHMSYMRPPEGSYSQQVLAVAQDLGYKTIFWSFAYKDWDPNNQKGTEYAFNEVTSYLHEGAILLLHAVSKDNANALKDIITYARSQGYEFRSLDQLNQP